MRLLERIESIIKEFSEIGQTEECVVALERMFEEENIYDYIIEQDCNVLCIAGIDIEYISIAWNDDEGLHLHGGAIYS